jgi:hypothetical protein
MNWKPRTSLILSTLDCYGIAKIQTLPSNNGYLQCLVNKNITLVIGQICFLDSDSKNIAICKARGFLQKLYSDGCKNSDAKELITILECTYVYKHSTAQQTQAQDVVAQLCNRLTINKFALLHGLPGRTVLEEPS